MTQDSRGDEKHPGGRPTKYRPEYCERVLGLGREGLSVVEMAAELEIHRETLEENWPAEFPEFSEAFTRAKELSQAWWEAQGRKNLLLPPGAGTFNGSVWSRSMAARFPRDWREQKGVELTGANGGPVQVEAIAIEMVSPKRET
jgi:hypothetical protein